MADQRRRRDIVNVWSKPTATSATRRQCSRPFEDAVDSESDDDDQCLAVLAVDRAGELQVYSSEQTKQYLNEPLLRDYFKTASEKVMLTAGHSSRSEIGGLQKRDTLPANMLKRSGWTKYTKGTQLTSRLSRHPRRSIVPRGAATYTDEPSRYDDSLKTTDVDAYDRDLEVHDIKKLNVFRIDDTEKVTAFLQSRLKRLQQLADKKIAKAWIKGICPKKQAKFPYQSNKRDEVPGGKTPVPEWWPDISTVCRFIEPDHIKRDERMRLCIHLLRLRPTPAQLNKWNHDERHPDLILKAWPNGWTGFLQGLAGNEIFDDLPGQSKEQHLQRQALAKEMYDVAALEESWLDGGRDGSTTYAWTDEEEERKLLPPKRKRQDSIISPVTMDSRESSVSLSCSRPMAKAPRRHSLSEVSTTTHRADSSTACQERTTAGQYTNQSFVGHSVSNQRQSDLSLIPVENDTLPLEIHNSILMRPLGTSNHGVHPGQYVPYEVIRVKEDSSPQEHRFQNTMPWQAPEQYTNYTTSFSDSSSCGTFESACYPDYLRSSPYQYEQDPGFTHDQNVPMQVHRVPHVAEPRFDALPTTPLLMPSGMVPTMDNTVPGNYANASDGPSFYDPMPAVPNQYYHTLHQESDESMIQHPSQQQDYHNQQAPLLQHINNMQPHGLPYVQATGWRGQ